MDSALRPKDGRATTRRDKVLQGHGPAEVSPSMRTRRRPPRSTTTYHHHHRLPSARDAIPVISPSLHTSIHPFQCIRSRHNNTRSVLHLCQPSKAAELESIAPWGIFLTSVAFKPQDGQLEATPAD